MGEKRKRMRGWAYAAALSLALAMIPAQAGGQETRPGGTQDGSTTLTARVRGMASAVEDQRGEVTFPDGSVAAAEGESLPDGLLLVVERIDETDPETYAWIAQRMEGLGSSLQAYDIYFVDSSGQRYEAEGEVRIVLSLDGAYEEPAAYAVPREGEPVRLESSVENGRITFTAADGYYVLAEQAETPEETESETAEETESETAEETESETAEETETESETAEETESETAEETETESETAEETETESETVEETETESETVEETESETAEETESETAEETESETVEETETESETAEETESETVEETESETAAGTESETAGGSGNGSGGNANQSAVRTGDETNAGPWLLTLFVSGAGAAVLAYRRRKRQF